MTHPLVVGVNVRSFRMSGFIRETAIRRGGLRGSARRLGASGRGSVRRYMSAANTTDAAALRTTFFLGQIGGKRHQEHDE
jgi:hypothetical protein